jgi:hypothetical protein
VSFAVAQKIRAMVDLETKGRDTKNPDLFSSMIQSTESLSWAASTANAGAKNGNAF